MRASFEDRLASRLHSRRVDVVTAVIGVHAVFLVTTGAVLRPLVVAVAAAALVVWQVAWNVAAGRKPPSERGRRLLWRAVGSLVAVAVAMVADGGTNSPLFFWALIVVAGAIAALDVPRGEVVAISSVGVTAAVAAVADEVNPVSIGRLLLLVGYLAVLVSGRVALEHHRRQAERSEAMVGEVFDAATMPLVIVGESGEPRANAAARAVGIGDATAVEETDGTGTLAEAVAAATGPDRRSSTALYTVLSDGSRRVLRIKVEPVGGGGGGVRTLVSGEDVTDAVELERARRRFLDAANHQFRTPLSPILGYAELLASGDREPAFVDEAAAVISAAARRLTALLDRTAALTRLQDVGRAPTATISMGELIAAEVVARDRDLALDVDGDERMAVLCNPSSIGLAVFELVDNGRRHGAPPVTVRWRRDGPDVVVEVLDAGSGPDIDPAARLDQVWEPVSATDVMPPHMGTRLGLAAAATLAEIGGGDLRFARTGNRWAFAIRLPAA